MIGHRPLAFGPWLTKFKATGGVGCGKSRPNGGIYLDTVSAVSEGLGFADHGYGGYAAIGSIIWV